MDKTLKIALLLTAVDHMSERVNRAVEKSQKKLRAISGINAFGSMAITGGTAMFEVLEKTIDAAEENKIAVEKLDQVYSHSIKNYHAASEASQEYASKLEMQIGLEDETIMAVQAKLGIFKRVTTEANLSNGIFNRATRAAFDMQAAGFGQAEMNIVKLGKVLDNPIKSMNALSKVGIIFNKTEQTKIQKLVQSGKLFEAQDLILKKVEGRVGGVAEKTASSSSKMKAAWSEVSESLGKHLLPYVVKFQQWLIAIIPKIQMFIDKHPQLVKWLGIAAVSLLGLGIAAKVVAAAMTLIEIASSPVTLIVLAIAALAFVLIKYWKPISGFFIGLWNGIKAVFSNTWRAIKTIFLNYTPLGLVIKYWKPIKNFFTGLWNGVKAVFSYAWQGIKMLLISLNPIGWIYNHWNELISWFSGLGTKFYNAGANIVKSIGNGIKSMIMWPINQVKNMVTKIRNFLPFSPAKAGPLKDLHRIKLVETIAASINSKPLIKAMSNVMGDVAGYSRAMPSPVANAVNGGSVTINYNPTINGGADGMDLRKHAKEIAAMVNEEMRKRDRTKF
jgi:transcriptional regulator